MHYFTIAYLAFSFLAVRWCVRHSKRHGVVSTFTTDGVSRIFGDLLFSPVAAIIVVPFAIAFWPLLCLMDVMEVPKKKKLKQQRIEAANSKLAAEKEFQDGLKQERDKVVGKTGVTIGVLSPMGKVRIDGMVRDANAGSEYIPDSKEIIVTGVRGKTVEVSIRGSAVNGDSK